MIRFFFFKFMKLKMRFNIFWFFNILKSVIFFNVILSLIIIFVFILMLVFMLICRKLIGVYVDIK